MKLSRDITVIGAGLGGLSTALRLASRGYKVRVIEKNSTAGGRLNRFSEDGFTFDTGPSFLSMTYEFDELFRYCFMNNPLKLKKLDPLYRVHFRGGHNYDIWSNLEKLAYEFRDLEPDFISKVSSYLKKAEEFYFDTERKVIKSNFTGSIDYLMKLTRVPLKHLPYLKKSLWDHLDKTFDSDEVKIIFSLVAFFLGSTPFKTPSIFSILNFTELKHNGYWAVKGGMYGIVEEILKALDNHGVEIVYNTEIAGISQCNGRLNSVFDKNGKQWNADAFVINSDAALFRGEVFKRKKYSPSRLEKMNWSLAPLTIYLGVKGKIPGLYYHNYFLGDNFRDYASKIFTSEYIPSKPYYYVNMPSYLDDSVSPDGCENLFILCPVPDLRFKKQWNDKDEIADDIIKDLSQRINFDIHANTMVRKILSPSEWESMFNLYKGSGLGLSHNISQVGGLRPSNKDEMFNNVYYVGASTVPGTGLPMVLISSKLVSERVIDELPYL